MSSGRTKSATLLALIWASGVMFHAPHVHAEPSSDNRAAAQVLFDRGRELVERNRSPEACPQFAESQRLDPGIGTLLWLADCYENTGQTASAWTAFSQAAADAAQRRDAREAIARERAAKLETTLSRLTIVVSPEAATTADLQIHCDGVLVNPLSWGRPIPLDPGSHTITANAPGRRLWWTTAQLALGAAGTSVTVPELVLETASPAAMEPPVKGASAPPASGPEVERRGHAQRVVAVAVAAGGGAAILAGALFALNAKAKYDASNDGPCLPDNECTPPGIQDRSSASSMATLATVAIGGGAAIVALATALYVSAPKDAPVAFSPSAHGGSLEATWRW